MELPVGHEPKTDDVVFTEVIVLKQVCTKCLVLKPLHEFSQRERGKRGQCKACRSAYMVEYQRKPEVKAKHKIYQARWRERHIDHAREKDRLGQKRRRDANPEQVKEWEYRRRAKKYSVTVEWIKQTEAAQQGFCGICGQLPGEKGLAVDHCHKTGAVRGLLCGHCNTTLHKMESDPLWFQTATRYLEENR